MRPPALKVMRSTNEKARKRSLMFGRDSGAGEGGPVQAVACAARCARMTTLQKVSGVNRRGTSAAFSGVLNRSAGTSVRNSFRRVSPASVTMPLFSNSASGSGPRASSTILPRGIFAPNPRSSRNTRSRKSIDSASRPSISGTLGLTSSTSQPSASAMICATFGKTASISCWLIACSDIPSLHLEAAIDVQHLAGDVIGEARRQEPDGMGHVLCLPVAAQEDACLDFVAGQVAHLLRHLGFYDAG